MNVEQRLVDALRDADRVEPSPDLWSRVVHSIEEDRAHRRRVVQSVVSIVIVVAGLVIVGALGVTDGPNGRQVRLPVMELIETVALVALIAVLGPAIRRFGRGYAADLWPATPTTPTALLRLLDVAYFLVFSGFILLTSDPDFGRSGVLVAKQVEQGLNRTAGFLLVMGLLHALTIMALPVVALVSNSTRVGRALPRWLVVIMAVVGLGVGFQVMMAMLGLIAGGE